MCQNSWDHYCQWWAQASEWCEARYWFTNYYLETMKCCTICDNDSFYSKTPPETFWKIHSNQNQNSLLKQISNCPLWYPLMFASCHNHHQIFFWWKFKINNFNFESVFTRRMSKAICQAAKLIICWDPDREWYCGLYTHKHQYPNQINGEVDLLVWVEIRETEMYWWPDY